MTNRLKVSLLVAGLMLATTSIAAERGPHTERMQQRGGPEMAGQVIKRLARAVRQLDLSEEQQAATRAEFEGFRESVKPLVKELHQGRIALHEAVTDDIYDADAVAGLAQQQGKLVTEITIVTSEAAAAVLARLSDEQRAELKAMAEERRAHRAMHRDMSRAWKGGRRGDRAQDAPGGN